jgi:hypothetical protein
LVEQNHPELSIRRQCALLGLNRSSFDHEPATETIENLRLMRRIDEQYLKTPFFGSRRMAAWLAREGEEVNACERVSCAHRCVDVVEVIANGEDSPSRLPESRGSARFPLGSSR